MDALDRHLVAMLAEDGRRTYTSMAAELQVSEATVRTRVTRLEDSGVLRIVALCNPLTLGHESLRLFVRVHDHTPRQVALTLADLPAVNHVALCTGSRDIYLEATCRDVPQVAELLDVLRRVPGVDEVDVQLLTTLHKDYSWVGLRGGTGQQTAPPRGQ